MFSPVPMRRLQAIVLARDERAVLHGLGQLEVVHLASADAEVTLSHPPDHREAIARCDHLSARVHELAIPPLAGTSATLALDEAALDEAALDEAEESLHQWEMRIADLRQRRRAAAQRRDEALETTVRVAPYRESAIPLDQLDSLQFLHFITGSLPTKNLANLQTAIGDDVALWPLAACGDRQPVVAACSRGRRPALEAVLRQAGFRPETLSTLPVSQLEQARTDVTRLDDEWKSQQMEAAPLLAAVEQGVQSERRLLEAEQQFPRTATAVLLTGWVPAAESGAVESRLREMTDGRCVVEWREAEAMPEDEVPVLLCPPRWFASLCHAGGSLRFAAVPGNRTDGVHGHSATC